MATTEHSWRELPTEFLATQLAGARYVGHDHVRFGTIDWGPNAARLIPVAEVEAELAARARCD